MQCTLSLSSAAGPASTEVRPWSLWQPIPPCRAAPCRTARVDVMLAYEASAPCRTAPDGKQASLARCWLVVPRFGCPRVFGYANMLMVDFAVGGLLRRVWVAEPSGRFQTLIRTCPNATGRRRARGRSLQPRNSMSKNKSRRLFRRAADAR